MGAIGIHPQLMQTLEFLGGAAAGAAVAAFANQAVKTAFPKAPAWIPGAIGAAAAGAAVVMAEQTPLIMGVEAGFGGMSIAFLLNETVISLPGISGMPPDAVPGYISRSVNGYRGIPPNRVGTFSGEGARSVNGLYTN